MTEKDRKRKLAQQIAQKLNVDHSQKNYNTAKETGTLEVANKKDYARELEKHLNVLFEDFDGDLFIEVRPLDSPEDREFLENTATNREKIARKYALKHNVCVGIHPRLAEDGTAAAVLEARFLVLDFDPKDKEKPIGVTHQEILTFLNSFGLKPRLIVSSGNGYHAYLKADTVFSVFEFTKLQEALISFLNKHISFENAHADNAIKDAPRLIRLAATLNTKNNETKLTRIVYEDPEAVVKLEDIYHLVQEELKEKETKEPNSGVLTSDGLQKLIEAIKQQFIQGRRQFLVLGLAGVLAKNGRSEEEALQIYRQQFAAIDDPKDARMREAAINRTFKLHRSGREVAGVSLLRQHGVQLSKEPAQHNGSKNGSKMKMMTSVELANTHFEKREHIVEKLIGVGLTILAGKSKIGKSWFSLLLALHVATDTKLFDTFEVRSKGKKVYYFALEDFEERLQERQKKLLENLKLNSSPERLIFVFNTPEYRFVLDDDGYSSVNELAKEACLIIIDTYGRARTNANYKSEYVYEYTTLGRLQDIAKANRMAIMVVHHTRKQYSEDVFDNILGSTALIGVTDTTMVLERLRKQDLIKLHLTSRDFGERSFAFRFNENGFTFEGDAELVERSQLQREVLEILKAEAMTLTELSQRLQKDKGTIYKVLQKLLEENLIRAYKQGRSMIYIAR